MFSQSVCNHISTAPFVYLLLTCLWSCCIQPCGRMCCPCCNEKKKDNGKHGRTGV